MFLGSFENDNAVVTEPLLEGLNPKSPSETDLLLYLGIHYDQHSFSFAKYHQDLQGITANANNFFGLFTTHFTKSCLSYKKEKKNTGLNLFSCFLSGNVSPAQN